MTNSATNNSQDAERESFMRWFHDLKDRRNNRHMDEPDFDEALWQYILARDTAQRQTLVQKPRKKFIVVHGTDRAGADNHVDRIIADYLNSGWDLAGNMFSYVAPGFRIFCQPMLYGEYPLTTSKPLVG